MNKHFTPIITTANGYVLDCRKGNHIAPNDNKYCQCGVFRREQKGVHHWYAAENTLVERIRERLSESLI